MGAAVGRETDAVAFLARLADVPHDYDFYQTLRRLECFYADKPRWGEAQRPIDEPVRLGQDPDLTFAPAPLAWFGHEPGAVKPRLQVRLFGLFGPNGPLPIHVTEYARDRLRNAGDRTLSRFLDLFHHRFVALFYRAWAQAQPHVNRDRPDADRFGGYVGALVGAPARGRPQPRHRSGRGEAVPRRRARASRPERRRAAVDSPAVFPRAGAHRAVRHALDGARARRAHRRWRARARRSGAERCSAGACWDGQHKFRVQIGSLTLAGIREFPAGRGASRASWSTGSRSISRSSSIGTSV